MPPLNTSGGSARQRREPHLGQEVVCDEAAHAVGHDDARFAILGDGAFDEPLQPCVVAHLERMWLQW